MQKYDCCFVDSGRNVLSHKYRCKPGVDLLTDQPYSFVKRKQRRTSMARVTLLIQLACDSARIIVNSDSILARMSSEDPLWVL
jgi:hypothetical protein